MSTCLIFTRMRQGDYRFDVEFLEEAFEFLRSLDGKTKAKMLENIRVSRFKKDPRLFKKIDKEIWEFGTRFGNKQTRLFAFWDKMERTLVIAAHGIIKKSQKTPRKEIAKTKRLRKQYFNDKN